MTHSRSAGRLEAASLRGPSGAQAQTDILGPCRTARSYYNIYGSYCNLYSLISLSSVDIKLIVIRQARRDKTQS